MKASNHGPDDQGRSWPTQRKAALVRDGHACRKCGRRSALHVHHIKPRRDGIDHSLPNLLTLCTACHHEWAAVEEGTYITHDEWLLTPHYTALVAMYRTAPPELREVADRVWNMLRELRAQEPIEQE